MAVPAGTFQVHGVVGDREDLSDVIYDISPMDTPFMSNIARESASAVLHEWQTDSLATPTTSNAQVEGDDATGETASATTRLNNYCQISWKVPQVSGTLRAVDTAGRRDELSYQVAKRGRELKRDMEKILCANQAASAGTGTTARKLAGLDAWISTNETNLTAAQTTPGAAAGGVPLTAATLGTATAMTEANLKAAIKSVWDSGGDPTVIMCGSFQKQNISGFTGIGTQYRDAQPSGGLAPGSIIGAADVYISDFGTHQVVANRFQPVGTVFLLDIEHWAVSYLRPISTQNLAKTGDNDQRMILAEYTLTSRNEAASGKVATTTSS